MRFMFHEEKNHSNAEAEIARHLESLGEACALAGIKTNCGILPHRVDYYENGFRDVYKDVRDVQEMVRALSDALGYEMTKVDPTAAHWEFKKKKK